jgi:hypothetical protein
MRGVSRPKALAAIVAASIAAAVACGGVHRKPQTATGRPPAEPTPPPALPVDKAPEDVIVAAWAEPSRLPSAGGQAQILVKLQKRGGVPFPGVQVRLQTSTGSLYSAGRVLVTDASGRTRDRLTTHLTAAITLNAGGTVYRFRVPVAVPAS